LFNFERWPSTKVPVCSHEPTFWRVEGSLLNWTAVRPIGFFTWNAQSFLERWTRRGGMGILAVARPFFYATDRVVATRLLWHRPEIIAFATVAVAALLLTFKNPLHILVQALPGVGRKTANVVLGNAFDKNEGIVVDTHVTRLSKRLGLTANTDAVKIEDDLMPVVPRRDWTIFSHLLIFHGRRVCFARKPNCAGCVLADICPSAFRV